MNRLQLKLLAAATMAVDHIGAVFFPQMMLFRMIGRLAFPIYCFLIGEGCIYTSDFKKYLKRLFLFAFLSEIPFDLAFHGQVFYFGAQNVFFTLFAGALSIYFIKTWFQYHPYLTTFLVVIVFLFVMILKTDYSAFGVAFVLIFYLYRKKMSGKLAFFTFVNAGLSLSSAKVQFFATFACIPLVLYNGQKGKYSFRYFFYLFYPVHLLIIYLVSISIK